MDYGTCGQFGHRAGMDPVGSGVDVGIGAGCNRAEGQHVGQYWIEQDW